MSIESTKSIPAISSIGTRDLLNTQNKNDSIKAPKTTDIQPSSNVHLSQATPSLLSPSIDDINMEKVQHIKQAIEDGKLVINAEKIADELINQTIQQISTEMKKYDNVRIK